MFKILVLLIVAIIMSIMNLLERMFRRKTRYKKVILVAIGLLVIIPLIFSTIPEALILIILVFLMMNIIVYLQH